MFASCTEGVWNNPFHREVLLYPDSPSQSQKDNGIYQLAPCLCCLDRHLVYVTDEGLSCLMVCVEHPVSDIKPCVNLYIHRVSNLFLFPQGAIFLEIGDDGGVCSSSSGFLLADTSAPFPVMLTISAISFTCCPHLHQSPLCSSLMPTFPDSFWQCPQVPIPSHCRLQTIARECLLPPSSVHH